MDARSRPRAGSTTATETVLPGIADTRSQGRAPASRLGASSCRMMARMTPLAALYRPSLALLDRPLPAHHGLRLLEGGHGRERRRSSTCSSGRNPFGGGFTVACGLDRALEYLAGFRFTAGRPRLPGHACAATTAGRSSSRRSWTTWARCACAATWTPCPRARSSSPTSRWCACAGRSSQGQLLETALLNIVNFQTLIATKAARVVPGRARASRCSSSACGGPRASTAASAASRAAYVGGCAAHLQRAGRAALRHPGQRHPRPQLGHVLRRRARGLRGLRRGACPTTASSWSTPTTRSRASATRSRWPGACASAGTS